MKKALQWLALLGGLLLCGSLLRVGGGLPPDNRPLVAEKYEGWSGVLRVWIHEGWTQTPDALAGWLNRCGTDFEKQRNGIYVQIRYVDAAAISEMNRSGMIPPDVVLFPPGLLSDAEGLAPLDGASVRASLCRSAYAVPVAMGGYAWAVNDSSESDALLHPEDGPFSSWSLAAQSLGNPGAPADTALPEAPGIDLGLPVSGGQDAAPVADPTALKRFLRGEARAVLISQESLRTLTNSASAPDWRLSLGGTPFTDRLLLASAPENGDAERQALSVEFIAHLLSDECQERLPSVGFFSTTQPSSVFHTGDPMAQIDAQLRRNDLVIPSFFRNG